MSAPPPSYSPPSYPPMPQAESPSSSPSSSSAPSAKSTGMQLTHDAEVLIQMYIPPPLSADAPPYHARDLPLPFCVPQMSASANSESAFARGYNETLGDVGITQETMLNFIDGLNLAINASPPLRVVNVAGAIIGFVPNHWAMIAGTVMQTSAQIGIRILSKTLTDRYLRAANINLFKPRGLSVRLCTTPAMLRLITNDTSSGKSKTKETIDKIGRGVGTVFMRLPIPIVAPLASRIIHTLADKPPAISPTGRPGDPIDPTTSPVLMRRLALVENIALPLETRGMPPPAKPRNVMEMISSWGVKFDARSEAKKAKKMEERRRAWAQIQAAGVGGRDGGRRSPLPSPLASPAPSSSSMSMPTPTPMAVGSGLAPGYGYGNNMPMDRRTARRAYKDAKREIRAERRADRGTEREMRREMRAERKAERRTRKGQRKGLLSGMSRVERRVANADLLEYWATNKILWVVVMHADKDADIEDIAIAEDPSNEERVDEESWRREMELERDELEDDIESEEEWAKEQKEEDEAEHYRTASHAQIPSSSGSKS